MFRTYWIKLDIFNFYSYLSEGFFRSWKRLPKLVSNHLTLSIYFVLIILAFERKILFKIGQGYDQKVSEVSQIFLSFSIAHNYKK